MTQLLTPLDALDALRTEDETPAPLGGDAMLDQVVRMSNELSEADAYDAQILAGLVTP